MCEEIRTREGEVLPLMVDVTRRESVQQMVQEALTRCGRIDIMVNIVGGLFSKRVLEMDEPDWDWVVNFNLKSVFLCCKAVLPSMIRRRYGKIVNLSSGLAFTGSETQAGYTTAKAGVVGFSKSLALEVIRLGINVNVIAPGLTATRRIVGYQSDDEWQEMVAARPMGRAVLPEEVVRAALFLVQDENGSITGQTIHVNGGSFMG